MDNEVTYHGTVNGYSYYKCRCLACSRARRDYVDTHRYGVPAGYRVGQLILQEHKCGICDSDIDASSSRIDHDHVTGRVRGILCTRCNMGLGKLRDDPKIVRAALSYLRQSAT